MIVFFLMETLFMTLAFTREFMLDDLLTNMGSVPPGTMMLLTMFTFLHEVSFHQQSETLRMPL
jgi:hypothetical protein